MDEDLWRIDRTLTRAIVPQCSEESGRDTSSFKNLPASTGEASRHLVRIGDCIELLRAIPDDSIQLIICDPPTISPWLHWDSHDNYQEWSAKWLKEAERVLESDGSIAIFGGLQSG